MVAAHVSPSFWMASCEMIEGGGVVRWMVGVSGEVAMKLGGSGCMCVRAPTHVQVKGMEAWVDVGVGFDEDSN